MWTQALHWVAIFATMNIVPLSGIQKMLPTRRASTPVRCLHSPVGRPARVRSASTRVANDPAQQMDLARLDHLQHGDYDRLSDDFREIQWPLSQPSPSSLAILSWSISRCRAEARMGHSHGACWIVCSRSRGLESMAFPARRPAQ